LINIKILIFFNRDISNKKVNFAENGFSKAELKAASEAKFASLLFFYRNSIVLDIFEKKLTPFAFYF